MMPKLRENSLHSLASDAERHRLARGRASSGPGATDRSNSRLALLAHWYDRWRQKWSLTRRLNTGVGKFELHEIWTRMLRKRIMPS
jgi:hypothetical protein